MGRAFLIGAQLAATVLFLISLRSPMTPAAVAVPAVLIAAMVINSLAFTRLVSWFIFAAAFFSLLVVLSAFTLRWRLEPGFDPWPFYRAMGMYTAFVYVSLAQIKVLGQNAPPTHTSGGRP